MKPFVFINVASSADGKISNDSRERVRISCDEDLKRVDMLRAESDAIMVGIGTVLSDNPRLTIKDERLKEMRIRRGLSKNPIRVVVDSRCRIPLDARILDEEAKTIVAVSGIADKERIKILRDKGVEVVVFGEDKVDLKALMRYLYEIGVRKLMVEGGATLNYSLLKEGLVDEIYIYYGNMIIAGRNSPTVVDGFSFRTPIKLELIDLRRIGDGILVRWKIRQKSL